MKLSLLFPVFSIALAVAGCHRRPSYTKPPTAVRVEPVVATTEGPTSRYGATILAQTQVELAFKTGGYVASIASSEKHAKRGRPLQAGDHVGRDTILASLRRTDFTQKYAELAGMSAEAAAGYRKAKADYDRAKQLFDSGSIPKAELDAAKSRADALAGSTGAAAARAGQANLALSDSQIRSPLDGIVLDRRVEVGALVQPGAPAFVIADTSTVRVVFGVPDNVQRTLTQGQGVIVTIEAISERTFSGVITKIAASADPKTRTFDVEATIDNADGAVKVGMVGSVQLGRLDAGPTILIPLSAIVRAPGEARSFAVFTLAGDLAAMRRVELGDLVGNRVAVPKGLAGGERVVIQGAALLQDGDRVLVVPGAQSGAIVTPVQPPGSR